MKPEAVLLAIVEQQGISILAQPILKGLILDMMPNAERKHVNVFKRAVEDQIGARLLDMQHDEPSMRSIKINTLKEKFKNDNAFDDTAYYIVDCFVQALDWNKPETVLPFKEIKIGNQIWADRNLDVSQFRNGDPITEARSIEEWLINCEKDIPCWCYYNNEPAMPNLGKLYNLAAIYDLRDLAPKGWRIPFIEDWQSLINQVNFFNMPVSKYRERLLKETIAFKWPQQHIDTLNDLGFEMSYGGFRDNSGDFYGIKSDAHFGVQCISNAYNIPTSLVIIFSKNEQLLIFQNYEYPSKSRSNYGNCIGVSVMCVSEFG